MGAESTDVEGECRLVDEEDGKKSNRVSLASCLKEPNAGFVYFYKPCIIVGIVTRNFSTQVVLEICILLQNKCFIILNVSF